MAFVVEQGVGVFGQGHLREYPFSKEFFSPGLLLKAAWDSKSLFSLHGRTPLSSRQAHGLHRWAAQLVPACLGEARGS